MMLSFNKNYCSFAWEEASIKYFTKHDKIFQLIDHDKRTRYRFWVDWYPKYFSL